jgi:hypothetical protein
VEWNQQFLEYRGKMNEASYDAATALVPKTYVTQGRDARRTHEKHIQTLIQQVQCYLCGDKIKLLNHHPGMAYGLTIYDHGDKFSYDTWKPKLFGIYSENCLMMDGVM